MELWNSIQEHLSTQFEAGFSSALLKSIFYKECQNDKTIVLVAKNVLSKGWFEENCLDIIADFQKDFDKKYDFRIEISQDSPQSTPAPKKDTRKKNISLKEEFVFDNFISGECNDFSFAAAQMAVKEPNKHNPIIITGTEGSGKTHLAQAIANESLNSNPQASVVYVTSEEFTNEFINSLQSKSMDKFRKKYRYCDLLIIEDIQLLTTRDSTKDELENIFDSLLTNGKQMVFTSDRSINKISGFSKRLSGRLKGGLSVDLKISTFETRKAILLDLAKKEGLNINDNVLDFIAETITQDTRELKATLVKLMAYADLKKKEISLKLAKETLSDKFNIELPRDISVADIQKAVASHFGIKYSDIKSDSKLKSLATPRQIAMYLASKYTDNTSTELGSLFKKSHSTVLRSAQKIEDEITKNSDLKRRVDQIVLDLSEH